MREHQIVITLKPEQFLEVQRLARAANAKSMGMFVRQKLLAALGIEGSLAPSGGGETALSPQAVNQILSELQRLHGELKGFVAESVSLYAVEPIADTVTAADQGQFQSQYQPGSALNDDFEELAARTFAISPRLGALESPPAVPDNSDADPLDSALPIRDPLESLLCEESIPKLNKDKDKKDLFKIDEDEEEYIPLALRQKRNEKAEAQKSTDEVNSSSAPTSSESDKDEAEDDDDANESADDDDLGLPKPILTPPQAQPPGNTGGSTPFSGGPPPKRRRE